VLTTLTHFRRNLAVYLVLCAFAGLLLVASAGATAKRPLADQPFFNLVPYSTHLGATADSELDLYMPASIEMAKLVVYIPAGYGVDLTRPAGATIGQFLAADVTGAGAIGDITAGDPAAYSTNTCAPGAHQAVWVLDVGNASQLPPIPVLVDPTTGTDTQLGAFKAQACLPSSATGTMRVRLLALDLAIFTNPAATGAYGWRAFVTPYAGGSPNDGATFELRATVPLPIQLTLQGRYNRRSKRAILTGRLTTPAYDVSGVPIDLYTQVSGRFRYTTYRRTSSSGRYTFTRRIKKTTRFGAVTDSYDDCAAGSVAPAGCLNDTLAIVSSRSVKVVVPRKRR
jgi:hypothetical protein